MKESAVEWYTKQILEYKSPTNINGTDYILIPVNKVDFLQEQAKVIEKNQRRKDFVNGYKERAKLSGKVFDEISEAVANKLFEKQEQ